MGPKARSNKKTPSPSPSAASSEASSSRSALEVEEAIIRNHSNASETFKLEGDTDEGEGTDDDEEAVSSPGQSDGDDSGIDEISAPPAIDTAKAKTKLHHFAKTLRATAKKSKMFEVQKLVKKLKGLRKKDSLAEQAALAEQELSALKSIDTVVLAGRALITKMVKAKLIPRPVELDTANDDEWLYLQMVKEEHLLGEEVLRDSAVMEEDRALERAKAKIASSKVLADEVGRFVDELKKLVGIESIVTKRQDAEADVKGKGKAKELSEDEDEDEAEREWSGSEEEFDSDDDAPRRSPVDDDDDEEDEDGTDVEELARIGRQKVKALGDLSQWDDMIGSDSEPESDSDNEAPAKQAHKRRQDSDTSSDDASSDEDGTDMSDVDSDSDADGSDSDSDDTSSLSSDRPRKRKSSTDTSKPSKKAKSSSTFLPSLSTGFVPGRSDDEWSDAEADLADRDLSDLKGTKKERKNRMGQRARKALYEKKYGKNANHIKIKEKEKSVKRESATRPAVSGGRQRPPAFQPPTKVDGGWGGPVAPLPKQPRVPFVPRAQPVAPIVAAPANGANGAKPAPTPTAKSQEMHPSWIAKQKQKELMAQVKPQGKKVVFD